jgi:mono/diheme cytochrome c family protein
MTAVEWLAQQMLHPENHNPYIEQALEMEKQQMATNSSQLTDEEIDKVANEIFESKGHNIYSHYNTVPSFIEGAKWYREQLNPHNYAPKNDR